MPHGTLSGPTPIPFSAAFEYHDDVRHQANSVFHYAIFRRRVDDILFERVRRADGFSAMRDLASSLSDEGAT